MSVKTVFQEGMKERRRRKSLGKVGGELRDREKAHDALLTALGRKAWEAKTDISAFPEAQAALLADQKALDELRVQAEQLQRQKGDAEAGKKRESDRLGAAIQQAEEKKREADARLNERKGERQNALKETQKASGRLAAIAIERTQLQNKGADPATAEAEKSEIAKGLERLAAEEAELKSANTARAAAEKPVAAQVTALQEDSARLQKQLDERRDERKRMLGEMDKKISVLSAELSRNAEKAKETDTRQKAGFRHLGEKLAAATRLDPNLAAEVTAVIGARSEMEGARSLISRLERQKDEGQVNAYRKMMAIIVVGAILLAAITVALFFLLSPGRKATPLEGLLQGKGAAVQNLGQLAGQMQKGLGNVAAAAEKIQGGKIEIASAGAMAAALPIVAGWRMRDPRYSRGKYENLETASQQADYAGPGGDGVRVQITDAGTASALLAPLKMVIAMGIRVDDADVMQQAATVNGVQVVERIDKGEGRATLGIVHKDRYLIELRTRSSGGLALLREFAARMDLAQLP